MTTNLHWPLMAHNIAREDLDAVIAHLQQADPILTNASQVAAFEQEWAQWLGVKYNVMVNSGSSANLLTLTALREHAGLGEIVVPALTWVSDLAAVLQTGFTPVFADIDRHTLGMATEAILAKLTPRTKAVFLTHILGYNALTDRLLAELAARQIPLIEDVCESYGATFHGRKLGSFGLLANFSFYYAHHLSTIEGGMISTNDPAFYQTLRMLRAHGMVRESNDAALRQRYLDRYPDLNPDFIFAYPAYNMRPTEINGIIGRSQLRRLDANNRLRTANLNQFLDHLDPGKYFTEFNRAGSCNYAFTLVLREANPSLGQAVMESLRAHGVEFRRGTSGGGNQLRQPYLRQRLGEEAWKQVPETDFIHFHGFYIGNYPGLPAEKILQLCEILNALPARK